MWLFTKQGFYSVVAKSGEEWHVRARAKKDLENLNRVAGTKHKIHRSENADYRWRIVVRDGAEAKAMIKALVDDIDYSNFKSACAAVPSWRGRLPALHRVWADMAETQDS